MNPDAVADWQELSELYEQADDVTSAALPKWLDALPAPLQRLRPQLEKMLGARDVIASEGFLEELPSMCADSDGAEEESDWREGHAIGPYRLIRHIGSGGMAQVWLAERVDGAFRRQVALKIPFTQVSPTQRGAFVERFKRERDILASLSHPNIASLLDAGIAAGDQQWLALEYVVGEPITTWCSARSLSVEGRVRVFCQVLRAVQYAHSNLIVHRDLKPANILVTSQGQVQLLDFGIAKLLGPAGGPIEDTELTRRAGRAMTLRYASPEQLLGRPLTTSCDIYALGVILYEILCGEHPYELKFPTPAQMEQAVLDCEPRAPSKRAEATRKAIAGDLDAITLKAMQKQPAGRYASVDSLLADLEHWLAGEPVSATTPTTAYRLGKFLNRHRLAAGLTATALLCITGAAIVAVVMGLTARQEAARSLASKNFLLDMFRDADPDGSKGPDITARELLEAGRERVHTAFEKQPALRAELLMSIGDAQASLGDSSRADAALAEAASVYRSSGMPGQAAMAVLAQAENMVTMGDLDRGHALLGEAERLAGSAPQDAELKARLSSTRGLLAGELGDLDAAANHYAQAVSRFEQADGKRHPATIEALARLAEIESRRQNPTAARARVEDAEQRAHDNPNVKPTYVLTISAERARLESEAGRFGRAATILEELGPACDKTLSPFVEPCLLLQQMRTVTLLRLGRNDEAAALVPMMMEEHGITPQRKEENQVIAVRALCAAGMFPGAAPLRARVRTFGQSGPEVRQRESLKQSALLAEAEAQLREGRPADALEWVDKAQRRRVAQAGATGNAQVVAKEWLMRGVALQAQGRHVEALDALQRSFSTIAGDLGPDHPLTLLFGLNRVRSLEALGRHDEAVGLVAAALPALESGLGTGAPAFRRITTFQTELESGALKRESGGRQILFFI